MILKHLKLSSTRNRLIRTKRYPSIVKITNQPFNINKCNIILGSHTRNHRRRRVRDHVLVERIEEVVQAICTTSERFKICNYLHWPVDHSRKQIEFVLFIKLILTIKMISIGTRRQRMCCLRNSKSGSKRNTEFPSTISRIHLSTSQAKKIIRNTGPLTLIPRLLRTSRPSKKYPLSSLHS